MPVVTQEIPVQKNIPAQMRDGTTLMANSCALIARGAGNRRRAK